MWKQSGLVAAYIALMLAGVTWAEPTQEQMNQAREWTSRLGDKNFKVREEATEKLIAMGWDVEPLIQKVLAETGDAEVRSRCEKVISALRRIEVREKSLGGVPASIQWMDLLVNRDGTRLAYIVEEKGKRTVWCDGKPGEPYDEVKGLAFSENGQHVAYAARNRKKWFVVKNGQQEGEWELVGSPQLSADGKRLAYWVRDGKREAVVVDGKIGQWYGGLDGEPVFSPDGHHLGYVGYDEHTARAYVVVDGKEISSVSMPYQFGFSNDSQHFTYVGMDEGWWLFRDGVKVEKLKKSTMRRLLFSPDRKRFFYVPDGPYLDGKPLALDLGERMENCCFSPDSKKFAYYNNDVFSPAVVVNGEQTPVRLTYFPFHFSSDSRHIWCITSTTPALERFGFGPCFVAVDGLRGRDYEWDFGASSIYDHRCEPDVRFSTDGQHLVYATGSRGKGFVVVDGVEMSEHRLVRIPECFDDDSGKLSYVVVDGEEAWLVQVQQPKDLDWTNGMVKLVVRKQGDEVVVGAAEKRLTLTLAEKPKNPAKEIQNLISRLGDKDFNIRNSATEKLIALGLQVKDLVSKALAGTNDPEVKQRCTEVLKRVRKVEYRVMSLGKIPQSVEWTDLIVNRDGTRIAYIRDDDGKKTVWCDGKPSEPYWGVWGLTFSTDGKHMAYTAQREKEQESFVVMDGVIMNNKEGKQWRDEGPPSISRDGKRVAYSVGSDDKEALYLDKKLGPWYDGVSRVSFSPDGKHISYVAWVSLEGYRFEFVVVDGKMEEIYKEIYGAGFSDDSKHFSYAAKGTDETWRIVMDGKEKVIIKERGARDFTFSPDRKHYAYLCDIAGTGEMCVIDGRMLKGSSCPDFCFSPNSKRWVYSLGSRMMIDGKEGPMLSGVWMGGFSPDSKYVWYKGQDEKTLKDAQFLVVNDMRGKGYPLVGAARFASNGRHLCYVAGPKERPFLVVDGLEGPEHRVVKVPDKFDIGRGRLRYVVVDGDEAWLVETDWPKGLNWKNEMIPIRDELQ